ncbi:MAG: GNAT family N-acetyltransferase [Tetrasphaera sp.]|nr:GNAT family N-acetyltransferase [Tetrasphaera sp.]
MGRGNPRQWPVVLRGHTPAGLPVELSPLRLADERAFTGLRRANAEWLRPWDATPPVDTEEVVAFGELVRRYNAEGLQGRGLPFGIRVENRLVGQLSVSSIVLGSFRSCTVGYWIGQAMAGRDIVPTAVALAGDHVLGTLGLHRIEINIRPENTPSLAVVDKLGFRDEGPRQRYLHIDGEWRDHRSFALTVEDLAGESLQDRLARRGPRMPS